MQKKKNEAFAYAMTNDTSISPLREGEKEGGGGRKKTRKKVMD